MCVRCGVCGCVSVCVRCGGWVSVCARYGVSDDGVCVSGRVSTITRALIDG